MIKFPDHSSFAGYWKEGHAEGRGIFKTEKGESLEGVWK